MLGLFNTQKKVDKLRKEVQDSFENVKEDISKVGDWIKHIDVKSEDYQKRVEELANNFEELKSVVEELKGQISFVNPAISQTMSRAVQNTNQHPSNNHAVQSAVQTAVQTGNLDHLTMMERAIVFILLNNEDKLSYEDISLMLGKDKSTVRGQINSIKQKNKDLISEFRELNGKKRLYIDETNKGILLKSVKVRVKNDKKALK